MKERSPNNKKVSSSEISNTQVKPEKSFNFYFFSG